MEQRNLIAAIVLSVAILVGWQAYVEMFAPPPVQETAEPSADGTERPSVSGTAPDVETTGVEDDAGATAGLRAVRERAAILDESPRVAIDTPTLSGSISLVGGRVDDLVLKNYRQTTAPDSENIVLLSPPGTRKAYYADFGWASAGDEVKVPTSESRWQADAETLTPGDQVTLSWDNGEGLTFQRIYEIDEYYMFTVTQRVVNDSGGTRALAPYGLISRRGTPDVLGYFILHEGLIGVFDQTLEEIDYDDVQDEGRIEKQTTGGWLGITDKYWLVSLIPQQDAPIKGRFVHNIRGGDDRYQSDFLYPVRAIPAGGSVEQKSHLFAGAKQVTLLDSYEEKLGIANFDLAVDFGWFYFLTKPFFYALHFFAGILGNFGLAILVFTVILKLVFFPLANKSYKAMAKMRNLQPKMLELRERFGDDKQRLNQEMMQLYRKEGANPAAGCLPIVVQIPVFFALYKVLFVTIEMRHAPFYGWISDLSAPDPTSILNLFGLIPWDPTAYAFLDILNIGVLPLLMGLTMFAQQRLNPQPADPMQAKIFLFLPIIFTFILARFPAGLVIYWTWNNILSIAQQYTIMKRHGTPIGGKQQPMAKPGDQKPAADAGGKKETGDAKAEAQDTDAKAETGTESASASTATTSGNGGASAAKPKKPSQKGKSGKRSGRKQGGKRRR